MVLKRSEDHIAYNGRKSAMWECLCDCGNIVNVAGSALKNGNTKSCGCYKREMDKKIYGIQNKKYNTYDLSGEYGIGYTEDSTIFYFDLEDYDKIKDYYWNNNGNDNYFRATVNKKTELLHRFIMEIDNNSNLVVDHINTHHREDNRKSNLRIVSNSENQMNRKLAKNNTSGTSGVDWLKRINLWRVRITINGQEISLGHYKNKEDAIKARKEAEEKYFGEHSYDNSQKQWKENFCEEQNLS